MLLESSPVCLLINKTDVLLLTEIKLMFYFCGFVLPFKNFFKKKYLVSPGVLASGRIHGLGRILLERFLVTSKAVEMGEMLNFP